MMRANQSVVKKSRAAASSGTSAKLLSQSLANRSAAQPYVPQIGVSGSMGRSLRAFSGNKSPAAQPMSILQQKWVTDMALLTGYTSVEVTGHVATWEKNGLSVEKLIEVVSHKQMFDGLLSAKSVHHQRVIIGDYESVPGLTEGYYVNNSRLDEPILASDFGVSDSEYDLPAAKATTFTGPVVLRELEPGEKLYRVTTDHTTDPRAKTGGFWTRIPPAALADVIGETAVRPEWNNFQAVYVYEVPPYADPLHPDKIYVWEGAAAAQRVSDTTDTHHLAGGGQQVFLSNKIAWAPGFSKDITDITPTHKKW